MKNKLIVNYLYNLAYQVLLIIAPLVTTPYVSRILGAEGIGLYSYTTSIISYFSLFLLLGMHLYGQREIAYNQNDYNRRSEIFWNVQMLKLITFFGVISIYSYYVFHTKQYKSILLIQTIVLVGNYFDISWFYQGIENFRITVIRNSIIKIIGVCCIFLFIKESKDLPLYILINVGITAVGNVSLWFYLPHYIKPLNFKKIQPFENFKTVIELFLPLIAVQVYYVLDKTMLGVINNGTMFESGYYEQTTKIVNLCMVLITSISTVLIPRMSAAFALDDLDQIRTTTKKCYHIISMMCFPIAIGLISISSIFVPWFFGDGYHKVILLMKVYPLVLIIIPFSSIAGNAILTPTRQHNKSTIAVVLGASVNFVFNAFLIRKYGSLGATYATIIAEFIVMILHLYFSKNYIDIPALSRDNLKFLFAAIIMGCSVCFTIEILSNFCEALFVRLVASILVGVLVYSIEVFFVLKDRTIFEFFNKNKIGE